MITAEDFKFEPKWDEIEACLKIIIETPERWRQSNWVAARSVDEVPASMLPKIETGAEAACGTTACLAGHAMIRSGEWKPVISEVYINSDDTIGEFEVMFKHAKTGNNPYLQANEEGFDNRTVDAYIGFGALALGLDYETAGLIFGSTDWSQSEARDFADWVRRTINERAEELDYQESVQPV